MNLPLVDPFYLPYEVEVVAGRPAISINGTPKASLSTAYEVAIYMANKGVDNRLGDFIQNFLNSSQEYKSWQKAMPSATPRELSLYQKRYSKCDLDQASKDIKAVGGLLSDGQCIFHGGLWNGGSGSYFTGRPLSTSLCPQVALRNAEHKGKAYDNERIDLLVLRATNITTKAFVYKRKATNFGHETEVLLAAGAQLNLRSKTLVNENYLAYKWESPEKSIPVYVLEIDVS